MERVRCSHRHTRSGGTTKAIKAGKDKTMDRNDYILDEQSLRDLADGTPCAEGAPLEDFLEEGKEVVRALDQVGAASKDQRVRLLAMMRGFYFLGVLRGGEEYRNTLQAKEEVNEPGTEGEIIPPMPFALAELCAEDFVEEAEQLDPDEWAQVCDLLRIPNKK